MDEKVNLRAREQRCTSAPKSRLKIQKLSHSPVYNKTSSTIQTPCPTGQLESTAVGLSRERTSLKRDVVNEVNSVPMSANTEMSEAEVREGDTSKAINNINMKSTTPTQITSTSNESYSKYNLRNKRTPVFKFESTSPVYEVNKKAVKQTTLPNKLKKNLEAAQDGEITPVERAVPDSRRSSRRAVRAPSHAVSTTSPTSPPASLFPEKVVGNIPILKQCDTLDQTSEKTRIDDKQVESISTSPAVAENCSSFEEHRSAIQHETAPSKCSEGTLKSTEENKTESISDSLLDAETPKTNEEVTSPIHNCKELFVIPTFPVEKVFADTTLSSTVTDETKVPDSSSPNMCVHESNSIKSSPSSLDSSPSSAQTSTNSTDNISKDCNTLVMNQRQDTANSCTLSSSSEENKCGKVSPDESPILQVQNNDDSMNDNQLLSIYSESAAVYECQFLTKQWKPLHNGMCKLVFDKLTEAVSIVLQKGNKVCMSHRLTGTLKFTPLFTCDRAYSWCAVDFSDPGSSKLRFFALKFRSNEAALSFKRKIDTTQSMMTNDKISLSDLEHNLSSYCKVQSADAKLILSFESNKDCIESLQGNPMSRNLFPVMKPFKKNTEHAVDGLEHECELSRPNEHVGVESEVNRVDDSSGQLVESLLDATKTDVPSISCPKNTVTSKRCETIALQSGMNNLFGTLSSFTPGTCTSTTTSGSVSFSWGSPINQLTNRSDVSNFSFSPCKLGVTQEQRGSVQDVGFGCSDVGVQTECPPTLGFTQTCPPAKDISKLKEKFGLGLAAASTKSIFSFNSPPSSFNTEVPASNKPTTDLNTDTSPSPKSSGCNFHHLAVNTEPAQNLNKSAENIAVGSCEQINSQTAFASKSDESGMLQTKAKESSSPFGNCSITSSTPSFKFSQVSNFGKTKFGPFFSNPFSTVSPTTSTGTQSVGSGALTQAACSVRNAETTAADGAATRNSSVYHQLDDVTPSGAQLPNTSLSIKTEDESFTGDVVSENLFLQTQSSTATSDVASTNPCVGNTLEKPTKLASGNQASSSDDSSNILSTCEDPIHGIKDHNIFSFSNNKNDSNSKSPCIFGNKKSYEATFGSTSKSGGNSFCNLQVSDSSKSVEGGSTSNLKITGAGLSKFGTSNLKPISTSKPTEDGDDTSNFKFTGFNFSLGSRVELQKQNKPIRRSGKKAQMQLRNRNAPPVEDWEASLLRSLECPVCLEPSTPPIFTCIKGHHICSKCRPRIKHCGICKAQISTARNWVAEDISIKIVKVPCKNFERGCITRVYLRDMPHHLQQCSFSVNCTCDMTDGGVPIPCLWRGSLVDLDQHVEEKHTVLAQGPESGDQRLHLNTSNSVLVKFDGSVFQCSVVYSHVNDGWYPFCRLLGRPEDAAKFACEFKFFAKTEADRNAKRGPFNLTYSSQVLSFTEDYRKLPILVINGNLFESLMQNGQMLFYVVKIISQ